MRQERDVAAVSEPQIEDPVSLTRFGRPKPRITAEERADDELDRVDLQRIARPLKIGIFRRQLSHRRDAFGTSRRLTAVR